MNAQPISEKKPMSVPGRTILAIFGVILVLIGLVGFWFVTLGPLINVLRARSWPTADCTIVSSRIEEHHDDDGSSYTAEITFDYNVDNQPRRSDSWSFFNPRGSHSSAQAVVREYPAGRQTTCYYNPSDPGTAVLNRSFYWWSLFGLLFLLAPLFGVLMVAGAVGVTTRPRRREKSTRDLTSSDTAYEEIFSPAWLGPQRLKPDETRVGRLVGLGIFGLIWNGIVAIPVYMFVTRQVGMDWCFALFLVPFVFIGVAIVFGVIYQLLALTNPVVEIALSQGTVAPGETVDVAWETKGRIHRIRSLSIAIDGSEQARYTRGTDVLTDEESFCFISVANLENQDEMAFGSQSVTIPADAIPSLDAPNNKIIWSIRILGDLPFWPDISEQFQFRVKPQ